MTEAEWLGWVGDPGELYSVVSVHISDRALRLFACACVRQVWEMLSDGRSKRAVPIGELLADGEVSETEAMAAAVAAHQAAFEASTAHGVLSTAEHLAVAAKYTVARSALIAFAAANRAASARVEAKAALQRVQSALFRDILGNPFRPVVLDPAWLTPTVVQLAQTAYEERQLPSGELDLGHLAILADALEEAGCTDAAILGHLRGPGPHVRGCWVLDLLLGLS